MAGMDQIRPQFGFHQHTEARRQPFNKMRSIGCRVVRQVADRRPAGKQLQGRFAAGGRHLGHDQWQGIEAPAERLDQRRRGAGFPHRNGMQPDAALRQGRRILFETFVPVFEIGRLPACPPSQIDPRQRQQRPGQQPIGAQRRTHARHSASTASTASTAPTSGH